MAQLSAAAVAHARQNNIHITVPVNEQKCVAQLVEEVFRLLRVLHRYVAAVLCLRFRVVS